jgi:hypothetical protein
MVDTDNRRRGGDATGERQNDAAANPSAAHRANRLLER